MLRSFLVDQITQSDNSLDCGYLFCGPSGPSAPFSTPLLFVCDALRFGCVIFGFAMIVLSVWSIALSRTPGQKSRFLALALLGIIVGGTEMTHLGDYPSARLLLNVAGVALGLYGVWRFRREIPTEDRPRGELQRGS